MTTEDFEQRDRLVEDIRDLVKAARGVLAGTMGPYKTAYQRQVAWQRVMSALEPFNQDGEWVPARSEARFADPDEVQWEPEAPSD